MSRLNWDARAFRDGVTPAARRLRSELRLERQVSNEMEAA